MSTDQPSSEPLLERLRNLEHRLNSLGSGSESDIEPILESIARRESRRGRVYAEILRNATSFAVDIAREVDGKLGARLDPVGDRAVAMLERQAPELELQHAERCLGEQEARAASLAKRFADLRNAAAKIEERLASAGEALDQVWKQQDGGGIGDWRMVMRSVAATVESAKEAGSSPAEQYRDRGAMDEKIPAPAANLVCRECNKAALRRVQRVSLLEEVLRVAFLSPYRCGNCGVHSYHFRYTVQAAG